MSRIVALLFVLVGGQARLALAETASAEVDVELFATVVAPADGAVVDEELVRGALAGRTDAIAACYGKKAKTPRAGEVVVFLAFDKKGKVTEVRAGGLDDAAAACVTGALKKARLGVSARGAATARLRFAAAPAAVTPAATAGEVSQLTVGDGTVSGGLARAVVREELVRRHAALVACHLKGGGGKTEARWTVALKIDAGGRVTEISATGDGGDATHRCVETQLRAVRFPEPTGGATVEASFPVVFRPRPPARELPISTPPREERKHVDPPR